MRSEGAGQESNLQNHGLRSGSRVVSTVISMTDEVVESETYGALPLSYGATFLQVAPAGFEPAPPGYEPWTPIRQSVMFPGLLFRTATKV